MSSPDATTSDPRRIELFVRSAARGATDRTRAIEERLRRLEADGRLALDVRTWGSRARDGASEDDTMATVRAFESWADRNGASLRPAFERRRVSSAFTGEDYEAVTLPVICLAVYDGDDLVEVFPHTAGGRVRTVEDRLAALESGRERNGTAVPA